MPSPLKLVKQYLGFTSANRKLDIGQTTPDPQVIKIFFMLNSAGHEISNAHKYQNIKKFSFYQAQISPSMLFFLLINVKMPTSVGILTFMSRKNFMLS